MNSKNRQSIEIKRNRISPVTPIAKTVGRPIHANVKTMPAIAVAGFMELHSKVSVEGPDR